MKFLKPVLFSAAILLFHFLPSTVFAVEWVTDLSAALDEAEERGAPLFIYVMQEKT